MKRILFCLMLLTPFTAQAKYATGLKLTAETQKFLKQAPRMNFVAVAPTIPKSASLRGKAGPVENQGQCGSCWDFSLTTVLRGSLIAKGHDPGRLSFNYLLNCNGMGYGCNGGDFGAAQKFVAPGGAPKYGSDGKYRAIEGTCQAKAAVASAKGFTVIGASYQNIPASSFKDIAFVISNLHQPVAIDIGADDDWMNYTGGVYKKCKPGAQINHMVVIEGYDCETAVDAKGNCKFNAKGGLPAGVGTYLIRNSWGIGWGDKGYVTMKASDKKGIRCNQVATDALFYQL